MGSPARPGDLLKTGGRPRSPASRAALAEQRGEGGEGGTGGRGPTSCGEGTEHGRAHPANDGREGPRRPEPDDPTGVDGRKEFEEIPSLEPADPFVPGDELRRMTGRVTGDPLRPQSSGNVEVEREVRKPRGLGPAGSFRGRAQSEEGLRGGLL